jgi:elongation factor G
VLSRELVPVCVGSALENKGGPQLLNAIQALLPSPLDHTPWTGADGSSRPSAPDPPVACFVFKTLAAPFAGQLTVLRVLSGTLNPDSTLLNTTKDEKERVAQLLLCRARSRPRARSPWGPAPS